MLQLFQLRLAPIYFAINIYPVSIRLSLTNSKKRKKKIKRNGKEEEEEQKAEKGMGQRVTLE